MECFINKLNFLFLKGIVL